MRWNKQNAQLQGIGKDLQPVQETEQPNKVTREPQETTQSAAPQLEANVYKNCIPLCAVLIGIMGIVIYMSHGHSMGEQSEGNSKLKQATTTKQDVDPFEI